MSHPIRIGILGCARICRRGMIEGIQSSGMSTLVAIASRNAETSRSWAEEFKIPRHYGDYEQLVADPGIDAVYIPLPNDLHRQWVERAAAAGKHVLCEKPLGLDLADAEAMFFACQKHGVQLMEAFMWRHHPRVARAKRMLADGKLGELRLVKMDFSFDIDRNDWRLQPRQGGGALFDLGCYGVNAARFFSGEEPAEIYAQARYFESGVDMTVGFQMRFPSGVLAVMDCSFECPYRNRIEIVGTRGAIEFPEGVLPPPEATLVVRNAQGAELLTFPPARQYVDQVRAFCASIAAGKLVDPAENGLANMRVLDAVKEAAAQTKK